MNLKRAKNIINYPFKSLDISWFRQHHYRNICFARRSKVSTKFHICIFCIRVCRYDDVWNQACVCVSIWIHTNRRSELSSSTTTRHLIVARSDSVLFISQYFFLCNVPILYEFITFLSILVVRCDLMCGIHSDTQN